MTKRHFIDLADRLRGVMPHNKNRQWEETIEALTQFCAAENPRFDKQRWLNYLNTGGRK